MVRLVGLLSVKFVWAKTDKEVGTHIYLVGIMIYLLQVESPSQHADASKDALYSVAVSVKSTGSSPVHEVYIDAHLHYTALKVR